MTSCFLQPRLRNDSPQASSFASEYPSHANQRVLYHTQFTRAVRGLPNSIGGQQRIAQLFVAGVELVGRHGGPGQVARPDLADARREYVGHQTRSRCTLLPAGGSSRASRPSTSPSGRRRRSCDWPGTPFGKPGGTRCHRPPSHRRTSRSQQRRVSIRARLSSRRREFFCASVKNIIDRRIVATYNVNA